MLPSTMTNDTATVDGITPTFQEAVMALVTYGSPELRAACQVMVREHDRLYSALEHYADLGIYDRDEARIARVALRREDPLMGPPAPEV